MKCTFCGCELPEGVGHCPQCKAPVIGAKRTTQAAGQPPQSIPGSRCVSCGAAIDAGAAFCPACGAKQGGPTFHEEAQARRDANAFWRGVEAKAKAERKGRWMGTLVRFLIFALAILILWYISFA